MDEGVIISQFWSCNDREEHASNKDSLHRIDIFASYLHWMQLEPLLLIYQN